MSLRGAAILLLLLTASAHTSSAQPVESGASHVDLREAERTWRAYVKCEMTRRFRPCYSLLSARVRDIWTRQGRPTIAHYADTKGSEEVRLTSSNITALRGTTHRVTVLSRARGDGEGGAFEEDRTYVLVREGSTWKVDSISVGLQEYLP